MKKANLMHDLDLKNILALDIEPETELTPETVKYFDICAEKLGLIPNVLKAYAFHADKLAGFSGMYNDLMLGPSGLTKLEREMIAVVVSSVNKCVYCLVAHGAALRQFGWRAPRCVVHDVSGPLCAWPINVDPSWPTGARRR